MKAKTKTCLLAAFVIAAYLFCVIEIILNANVIN